MNTLLLGCIYINLLTVIRFYNHVGAKLFIPDGIVLPKIVPTALNISVSVSLAMCSV